MPKSNFGGSFEEDWATHLEEFEDVCEKFYIEEKDWTNLLRYTLKEDAKKFYKIIKETNRPWTETKNDFGHSYASLSKQEEVSMRRPDLKIVEFKWDGNEDHSELDQLVRRINELLPLEKSKDRDEEEMVRYLCDTAVGTEWGLRPIIRTGDQPSFQSLVNALEDSQCDVEKNKHTIAKDGQSHAPS